MTAPAERADEIVNAFDPAAWASPAAHADYLAHSWPAVRILINDLVNAMHDAEEEADQWRGIAAELRERVDELEDERNAAVAATKRAEADADRLAAIADIVWPDDVQQEAIAEAFRLHDEAVAQR